MRIRKETTSRFERNNLIREGKKYRYYFFDYLYYRLYVVYRKHNEAERLSACLLLGMNSMVLFFFFCIFFNNILTDDWFSLKKLHSYSDTKCILGRRNIVFCYILYSIHSQKDCRSTFEIQRQYMEQNNSSMDNIFISSMGVLDRNRYMQIDFQLTKYAK